MPTCTLFEHIDRLALKATQTMVELGLTHFCFKCTFVTRDICSAGDTYIHAMIGVCRIADPQG
jgi:hypothetical protein